MSESTSPTSATRSEPTRDQLVAWDREIVWHAFTQMSEYEPLIIARSHG